MRDFIQWFSATVVGAIIGVWLNQRFGSQMASWAYRHGLHQRVRPPLLSFTVALLAILLLALTGCAKTEYGVELTEPGQVQQVGYVPGGEGSGTGVGVSGRGDVVVTSSTVTIPDRYAVVLRCRHGVFTLRPEGENAKRIFYRGFKAGDSVTIYYREEYRVTKVDGARVKELVDLDFLDLVERRTP